MKSFRGICLAILLIILFVGCIEVNLKIKLRPDGSGTIEETVLLSDEMVSMIESLMEFADEDTESGIGIYDEEELKSAADEYGKGVVYVSGEKISVEGREGYRALYEFEDISNVKIEKDPSSKVPSEFEDSSKVKEKEYIEFQFSKGEHSSLIIQLPESDNKDFDFDFGEDDFDSETEDDSEWIDEIKGVMEDFKILITLTVDGDIVETDATHYDGSMITLLEMNFKELFKFPEKLNELKKTKPKSFDEAEKLLKEIPGFKFEIKDKIEVKFD
ncbi:hypothetical protein ACFLS9_02515 [Bacteroidota bacterium]